MDYRASACCQITSGWSRRGNTNDYIPIILPSRYQYYTLMPRIFLFTTFFVLHLQLTVVQSPGCKTGSDVMCWCCDINCLQQEYDFLPSNHPVPSLCFVSGLNTLIINTIYSHSNPHRAFSPLLSSPHFKTTNSSLTWLLSFPCPGRTFL